MRQLQEQYLSNPEKWVEGYQEHRKAFAMAAKLRKTNNPSKAFDLSKEKNKVSWRTSQQNIFCASFSFSIEEHGKMYGCLTGVFFIRKYATKYF